MFVEALGAFTTITKRNAKELRADIQMIKETFELDCVKSLKQNELKVILSRFQLIYSASKKVLSPILKKSPLCFEVPRHRR